MGFLVFFIKRALATIPLLFAITVVAFTLLQAMPGDYADQWKNQTMMLGGISEEEAQIQADELLARFQQEEPVLIMMVAKSSMRQGDDGYIFTGLRPEEIVIIKIRFIHLKVS